MNTNCEYELVVVVHDLLRQAIVVILVTTVMVFIASRCRVAAAVIAADTTARIASIVRVLFDSA